MPGKTYQKFIAQVREIQTATSIEALLDWDQETHMPPKGITARAAALALVAGLGHEKLLDRKFARLLDKVEQAQAADPVEATNVREVRRNYQRRSKLSTALVQELARTVALAKAEWAQARAASDFGRFAPHLEKLLELKREVAERIGYDTEPYDALMDEYEPGARAARCAAGLRRGEGRAGPAGAGVAERAAAARHDDPGTPLPGARAGGVRPARG